ncbi:Short-chain dehydrogenase/reductase family protein [Mycena sanguinolenta]|uniref:Short-chain dehydrogenase/reductase family protein n=1 Tax=Mycena sanguinolenta TaxID=230812 RepID=A0A8H6YBX7_9AGAR|nr:Short-chain dehydrogenase/reductase family protein [Mycena sanguinolenta]
MAIIPVVPPLPDSLSFAGKSAVVTGANGGLGLAAALHLVQRNIATIILAAKRPETPYSPTPSFKSSPTSPPSSFMSLTLHAHPRSHPSRPKVLAEIPTLNIVILNAGMGSMDWKLTPEAETEEVFQVNFLSNAILSVRLLPLLRSSAESSCETSHLSIVGSRAIVVHSFTKQPVPDTSSVFAFVNDRAHFRALMRYSDSKLLVSMWVHELGKHVDPSLVIVNNVCPGMVKTNIDVNQPWWVRRIMGPLRWLAGRSTEVGARTLINAISAGKETHGEMLFDFTVWRNKFLEKEQGQKMEKKVWKETLAAAETSAPGSVEEAKLRD